MTPAILIQNLSKEYRLGIGGGGYRTLRESIMNAMTAPLYRLQRPAKVPRQPAMWALRDVSFAIEPGAVVGIVGRNGAGKSTLLKILSRITEPTAGRIELRGRVGSLLEVGTGFHSELTGRENIYLNGAILGMSRREIRSKFADIVAFAEVEAFLDTPVKRYSSGMYVRLAFAVASHLEPEILVVDEVLAVGDQAFQKKCLGRMNEVSRSGRTVLFVSHNMATILNLCDQVAVLDRGRLTFMGDCARGVELYTNSCSTGTGADFDLLALPHSGSGDQPLLRRLRLLDAAGQAVNQVRCGDKLRFEVTLDPCGGPEDLHAAVVLEDAFGVRLCTLGTFHDMEPLPRVSGVRRIICEAPELPFAPGRYHISLLAGPLHQLRTDAVDHAASFDVLDGDFYGNGRTPEPGRGRVLLRSHWRTEGGA